jgi:hypothetical protein
VDGKEDIMTTATMAVYDGSEYLGEVPINELPALIKTRKMSHGPLGTCRWVYDVYGPTGTTVLARGLESHQEARRVARAFGYFPIECWVTVVAA